MRTRPATAEDDLVALFPELAEQTVNYEQVLVLEHAGAVRAAAVLFHGGHSFALVGAVAFADQDRPEWAARALWRGVALWGKQRGLKVIGHLAVTDGCRRAMLRLGGSVRTPMGAMIEVPLC